MTNQKLRQAALCLALSTAPAIGNMAYASSRYDAVKDFSIKSNPNGVWTYMDSAPLQYAHRTYDGVKKLYNWSDDQENPFDLSIIRNRTGAPVTLDDGTLTLPTNYLAMHAEDNRPGAQLQFQAPSAGTYAVKLEVAGVNTKEAREIGVIVYQNGVAIASISVHGGSHKHYAANFALEAGDTLAFLAGGSSKDTRPDYIGIALKISGP